MVGGLEQGLLDDYDWMRLDVYGLSSRRLFDTISLDYSSFVLLPVSLSTVAERQMFDSCSVLVDYTWVQ
jgi:hypothetical protein